MIFGTMFLWEFLVTLNYIHLVTFRYFQCAPNYGLFAPLHKVTKSTLPGPGGKKQQQQQFPVSSSQQDTVSLMQNSVGALGSDSSVNSTTSTQSNTSLTRKLSAAQVCTCRPSRLKALAVLVILVKGMHFA